eukprot:3226220-Rhodomonas_salina.3
MAYGPMRRAVLTWRMAALTSVARLSIQLRYPLSPYAMSGTGVAYAVIPYAMSGTSVACAATQ